MVLSCPDGTDFAVVEGKFEESKVEGLPAVRPGPGCSKHR